MPEPIECAPHEAFYAEAVLGRNVPGGTETNEWYDYYRDGRPTRAMLTAQLKSSGNYADGWRVLEFKAEVEPGDPAGINGGPCVSGVADCPCCGYPTSVEDWRVPELCDECAASGCGADGDDPQHDPSRDD